MKPGSRLTHCRRTEFIDYSLINYCIVDTAGCSDAIDFRHLLKLHLVTASAAVPLNYVTLGHLEDTEAYRAEAHRVLERLVSSQHYDIARQFAETANINGDEITINEVCFNNCVIYCFQIEKNLRIV